MSKRIKELIKLDLDRYEEKIPKYERRFLKLLRKCQNSKGFLSCFYKFQYIKHCQKRNNEFPVTVKVGSGLYLGHTSGITINPTVSIGKNCNIHKNVTIVQENRGERKGTPTIGDSVYIGINSVIVGNVVIGDDVLIAPGAFVNFNVPPHSIVLGNPAKIIKKENATQGYIQNKIK